MKYKISIITAFPITIPHPRVELERKVLTEAGHEVKILCFPQRPDLWQRLVNYTSVNYFKKHLYRRILKSISDEDVIILYDFHLLPLARRLKKMKKKVIYESIDNMVHLNYHELLKHFPAASYFGSTIISHYSSLERRLAAKCDGVIVNSKALAVYFIPVKTDLIFYSSPFENEGKNNPLPARAALAYLGFFSKDKGSEETLALQKELNIPLFISGDISDSEVIHKVQSNPEITWIPRQKPDLLKAYLVDLQLKYRLFGCSIIHPIHHSYATQEANKDQDYLALGIPIIGNTRVPTYEKISAGCGVLYTNPENIRKLIENTGEYDNYRNKCLEFYNQHYSYNKFRDSLLQVVNDLSGQTK
jgi:hypothetical protein